MLVTWEKTTGNLYFCTVVPLSNGSNFISSILINVSDFSTPSRDNLCVYLDLVKDRVSWSESFSSFPLNSVSFCSCMEKFAFDLGGIAIFWSFNYHHPHLGHTYYISSTKWKEKKKNRAKQGILMGPKNKKKAKQLYIRIHIKAKIRISILRILNFYTIKVWIWYLFINIITFFNKN